MKCINRCVIKESELDDAVQLEGNQLICDRCFRDLFPEPAKTEDTLGRPIQGKATRRSDYCGSIGATRTRSL